MEREGAVGTCHLAQSVQIDTPSSGHPRPGAQPNHGRDLSLPAKR
jgi:hypothetical protein